MCYRSSATMAVAIAILPADNAEEVSLVLYSYDDESARGALRAIADYYYCELPSQITLRSKGNYTSIDTEQTIPWSECYSGHRFSGPSQCFELANCEVLYDKDWEILGLAGPETDARDIYKVYCLTPWDDDMIDNRKTLFAITNDQGDVAGRDAEILVSYGCVEDVLNDEDVKNLHPNVFEEMRSCLLEYVS